MLEEDEWETYASEALKWSETNEAVIQRFAVVHARHRVMLVAREVTPEDMAASKVVDLRNIQLPEDTATIGKALSENDEYKKLRKQAESWEKEPDYAVAGCMSFFFWPAGIFMRWSKRRSHKAWLMAEHIEYVVSDAYFRSIDPDKDYLRQLHNWSSDYWTARG